jgi:hypothetical protein
LWRKSRPCGTGFPLTGAMTFSEYISLRQSCASTPAYPPIGTAERGTRNRFEITTRNIRGSFYSAKSVEPHRPKIMLTSLSLLSAP